MTETELPPVAVLLLNWNGWRDTVECLESLFRLNYPADRLSVVLCDNASSDGSPEIVRQWARGELLASLDVPPRLQPLSSPPVRKPIALIEYDRAEAERGGRPDVAAPLVLIHNGDNLGFAGGNNVGLRYLYQQRRTRYVWVLNNDIVVAPDSLRRLVEFACRNPRLGGVGATIFDYRETESVQIAAGGDFSPWIGGPRGWSTFPGPDDRAAEYPPIGYVSGGCMLSPTLLMESVGLIDDRYFAYGEDVDYSLRIRAAGYALSYARDAHVWHKGGAAIGWKSVRHDYYMMRNNLYLVKKYAPWAMPVALGYALYRFVMPKLVRRQWDRLQATYRGFQDFRRGVTGRMPGSPTSASAA